MRVEPGKPRFSLQPQGTGVAIACPARRDLLGLLVVTVWVVFWTYGGISAFRELLDPEEENRAFLVAWLAGWLVGELFAIAAVVWQLAGREEITASAGSLTHRVCAAGLGRTREYAMAQVRNLRTVPLVSTGRGGGSAMLPVLSSGSGRIAFDYGASTVRVGVALHEAEAEMVVAELSKRFPKLAGKP
jgi:hypothetical protein